MPSSKTEPANIGAIMAEKLIRRTEPTEKQEKEKEKDDQD